MKHLLGLAWPIVISRSTQVIVSLTDAVMVAVLGETALAATTTGAMNANNLMILPMGIVFIVSSFAAQHHGAGNPVAARRYALYGLIVGVITEIVFLTALPLISPIVHWFPLAPEVHFAMIDYLCWRLPSAGAVVAMEALGAYYGGIGNTRLPMFANVLAMVLNVLFCWLFISGHAGAPALGVRGSALAATLATAIACAILLIAFYRGIGSGERKIGRCEGAEFLRMLRFGVPSGLNWFLEFAAFSAFINVVVAGLGTTALAAMMAVMQINMVAFMPAFGVASAASILVGQAIGEGKKDQVAKTVRLGLIVNVSWQAAVGIAYLCLPALILAPFSTGETFVHIGARLLAIAAAWQVFDACLNTYAECLRAAGDTTFTLIARVAVAWLFFFPGVWIQRAFFGISDKGAMIWVVVYIALLALILHLRFVSGVWRRFDLTGTMPG